MAIPYRFSSGRLDGFVEPLLSFAKSGFSSAVTTSSTSIFFNTLCSSFFLFLYLLLLKLRFSSGFLQLFLPSCNFCSLSIKVDASSFCEVDFSCSCAEEGSKPSLTYAFLSRNPHSSRMLFAKSKTCCGILQTLAIGFSVL